ncbi:hypothetical protein BD413DRAFT_604989 [Trametes elegans]|nr:hypothetical protein BD413DRAFT_604989 [Trametes elegans]
MSAVFSYVFGCCIRPRSPDSDEPDERTPFIQPADEVSPVRTYTVDHDRLRERLGTIVRSKEGKMVNVNQPLPFNMHGRPPHARPDRSVSANTTPPRPSSSTAQTTHPPDSPTAAAHTQIGRIPSYSPSREPSPSIQTSRSTSSLHPGDASYLPPGVDPDGGNRRPILNVRLVRGPSGFTTGGRTRQGQVAIRGRLGRPGEDRGRESGDEAGNSDAASAKGKARENASGVNGASDAEPRPGGQAAAPHVVNGNGVDVPGSSEVAAQETTLSALDSEFIIEDVGDIAQSWGD